MHNPSKYIKNICSDCHPQVYTKTPAEFTGKVDEIELSNENGTSEVAYEYLYKCCECGEKVWLDKQWIKNNVINI